MLRFSAPLLAAAYGVSEPRLAASNARPPTRVLLTDVDGTLFPFGKAIAGGVVGSSLRRSPAFSLPARSALPPHRSYLYTATLQTFSGLTGRLDSTSSAAARMHASAAAKSPIDA